MRIAFLGKGGSGKTTIAAAFIHFAKELYTQVFAVDADVNMHLPKLLRMKFPRRFLANHIADIQTYLRGDRNDLGRMPMIGTTPPSLQSRFLRPTSEDGLLSQYESKEGNVHLLVVGSYEEADIGATCYHGKLMGLENIFHHLLDERNDLIVTDCTAGTDIFGTSLHFAHDLYVLVVEPTEQSIEVYQQFSSLAESFKMPLFVVCNKILDEEDLRFVRKHIPNDKIIATFTYAKEIRAAQQGKPEAFSLFVEQNSKHLEHILSLLKERERNWDKYYAFLLHAHQKMSAAWYDGYYNAPISKQKDPEFSYAKVMQI